ncbi:ATP-binding protein [Nonomuraea sp. NPDC049646]|uniref:ATP-binding protein n=1 Tax=unclassified Nonomuraea TaxID=2593643 RepID=UPI0037A2232E
MVNHPTPTHWPLPTQRQSAGLARRLARQTLTEWGATAEKIDDALIVVSELVTNALVHALPPVAFGLERLEGKVRGEVTDHGPLGLVVPHQASILHTRGRGLNLVDQLADAWGVGWSLETGRKSVWFEMSV